MRNRHKKLLVSILVIVCLLVSTQPVSAEKLIASAFIDISSEVKPDYNVAYQYVEEKDGYLWKPDVEEGWKPSYDGELPAGSPWIPLGLWGSISGKTSLQIVEELTNLAGFNNDSPLVVEVPWNAIEKVGNNEYVWNVYDTFLNELKKQGRKAFVIIKINSLPIWFSDENKSLCAPTAEIDPNTGILVYGEPRQSNYLSYTNQDSKQLLEDYLFEFISRYAVGGERQCYAPVIAGWIIDLDSGYIDNEDKTYLGYEENSKEAFREWLRIRYENNIDLLNEKWRKDNESTPGYLQKYPYTDFSEADMPVPFVYEGDIGKFIARDKASWYDLIQWRKQNLAEWSANIIRKIYEADNIYAREGDKRHLISILTSGENEGDSDWQYSGIDIRKIVETCNDNTLPLDFCSVACTASTSENDEAVSIQWQLVRTRALTDLPVMIIKLGVKSTPDTSIETKSRILKANLWELMYGGAIGAQISDGEDIIDTEGLSYNVVKDIYATMNGLQMDITNEQGGLVAEMDFNDYLVSSQPASPEVGFLQTEAGDTIFNRAEAEIYSLYGPLKRLGFQPGFISEEKFMTGDYSYDNYKALILARNQKMNDETFDELGNVVMSGVKLHADADLPGLLDEYANPRHEPQSEELPIDMWDEWRYTMESIFGIDANNSGVDTNLEDAVYVDGYESPVSDVRFLSKGLECPTLEYNASPDMWKYRDELSVTFGDVLATFSNGSPAIVIKNNEAAISLFSLGDSRSDAQGQWGWQERYKFMELIYKDTDIGFGLRPLVNISGSTYVSVDYRTGPEDSVLVYVRNYNKDTTQVVELESQLFENKKIQSLISGQILSEYAQEGKVELQSLSAGGEEILLVTHTSSQNIQPTALFTVSATSVYPGDEITFNASGSYDDGSIVSYNWNFGDGTTADGIIVTHKYDNPGSYIVKLVVTDNHGGSSSAPPITVSVLESPNQVPVASFTASKTSPSVGEEVTFNASASSDNDGNIISYTWNFGDGTSGTGVIVTRKYDKAGSYTVELTVTDNIGANGTKNLTITVSESVKGESNNEKEGEQQNVTSTQQGQQESGSGYSYQPSTSQSLTSSTQTTQGVLPGSYSVVILDESSGTEETSTDKGSKPSTSLVSSTTTTKSSANASYKRTTVGNSTGGGAGGKERLGGIFKSEPKETSPLIESSFIEELPQQFNYAESEPPRQIIQQVSSEAVHSQTLFYQREGKPTVQGFKPRQIVPPDIKSTIKDTEVIVNENIFLKFILNSIQIFINFINKFNNVNGKRVPLFSILRSVRYAIG